MANERLFALDADVAGRRSAGDDEGFRLQPSAVHFQPVRRAGLELLHNAILEAGAEFFSLLMHPLNQLGTIHPVRESWEIFHGRRGGELPAGEASLENKRRKIGAPSVDCGCESGTSRANNDDIFHKRTQ